MADPLEQLNPDGTVCMTSDGRSVLRAEGADCGCTPPGGCASSTVFTRAGATYKIVVAGVTTCEECQSSEDDCVGIAGSRIHKPGVNRTYYVSANNLTSLTWFCAFLGNLRDDYSDNACSDLSESHETFDAGFRIWRSGGDDATTAIDGFADDQIRTNVVPAIVNFCDFLPDGLTQTYNPEFLWSIVDGELVVGAEIVQDNVYDACEMTRTSEFGPVPYLLGGTGGTMTITPCPPCAVECGGKPCAHVTISSSCEDCSLIGLNYDGEYLYADQETDWHGGAFFSDENSAFHVPAGCHWIWLKQVEEEDESITYRYLVVWFDGQDWRAILYGNGAGYAVRVAPAGFSCSGGELTGTLELGGVCDEVDDCTATITFGDCEEGDCPINCDECCDTITIEITGGTDQGGLNNWSTFNGTFVLTRSGTTYHVGGDVVIDISCVDGHAEIQMDNGNSCVVTYVGGNYEAGGPPESGYAYSMSQGGCTAEPDFAFTVTRSDCPP